MIERLSSLLGNVAKAGLWEERGQSCIDLEEEHSGQKGQQVKRPSNGNKPDLLQEKMEGQSVVNRKRKERLKTRHWPHGEDQSWSSVLCECIGSLWIVCQLRVVLVYTLETTSCLLGVKAGWKQGEGKQT